MPYIEVAKGVQLYCLDFGTGTPVVFTHAGLTTHKMWDHQTAALAGRFRTITYDWRGVGASDKPRSGYTTDVLVTDLCTVIERLQIGPAILVGHGVGTHVTVLAAEARPDLVKGMVLVSGAPWFAGDHGSEGGFSAEFTQWWRSQSSETLSPQLYAALCERFMFLRDPGPAVAQAILQMALETPLHVFNSYTASMRELDHRARLGRITCPTLVMHGRFDKKQRYGGGKYLAKHLVNGRLVTFEASAHMPQLEEVDTFNRELVAFIEAT
jgi:non-heme chloroperoxidase